MEHRLAVVCKCQIAKFYASLDRGLLAGFVCVSDRRFSFDDSVKSLERCGSPLVEIDDVAEGDQIPDHPLQIKNKRGKIAGSYLAPHRHSHADRDNDHKSEADKEEKHRAHGGGKFDEL